MTRVLRLQRDAHASNAFHYGETAHADVVASLANIGTAPAAAATERLLDSFEVHHVVVVGIAGGIDPALRIGELVVPEVVIDWSSGREYRPTSIGPVPARGGLITSDQLLYEEQTLAGLIRRGVVAVDMETAAVAAVCERRSVPWSVFRAVSDRAADAAVIDAGVMTMINPDGSARPRAMLRYLVSRPHRIPHLVRLGRGSRNAARTAAAAAARALT